jgi:hypothetical protein
MRARDGIAFLAMAFWAALIAGVWFWVVIW